METSAGEENNLIVEYDSNPDDTITTNDQTVIEMNTSNYDGIQELFTVEFEPDPYRLYYPELYDNIFDYLSVKDLLNLSETSKAFYNLIGKHCNKTMNRIKLVVEENESRRFGETALFTQRKYQHLEVKGLYDATHEMSFLIDKCADSLVTIRTAYDMSIANFLPSVEEIWFIARDMTSSKVTFDQNGLIANAYNLKRLYVWSHITNANYLARFVKEARFLEKLVLEHRASFHSLFEINQFNSLDCHLHTFHCDLSVCDQQKYFHYASFMNILAKQRDYLRDIKFGGTYSHFADTLRMLPYLEKITFAPFNPHLSFGSIVYHPRLVEVNLIQSSSEFIFAFIESNPDVQKLYVTGMDRNILKNITAKGRGVTVLSYAFPKYDDTLEDFKGLYNVICKNMRIDRKPMEIVQI